MRKSCKYDSSGHLWTTVWCWIWLHVKLPPGGWTWNLQSHLFKKEDDLNQTSRELCSMSIFRGVCTWYMYLTTVLPFCALVGWKCFSMVQKAMSQGHTMQSIIPYTSFGPLGLFQVFWFADTVGQHIITGHWNSLKNRRWIERYPCVSLSSAQKILVLQSVSYILHFSA